MRMKEDLTREMIDLDARAASDSKACVSASSRAVVRMERGGHDLRDIYSALSAAEAM